jgi:NAD(P)-dependent dehydrogenase (short-subunit alcohol dehydrogenase family)
MTTTTNKTGNTTPDLSGKIALVTGATAGIGLITAEALAKLGATVVIVSRNEQKCRDVVAQIQANTGNTRVEYIAGDLSAMAQVRAVAEEFLRRYDRLHILVNNAGAFINDRQVSADGFEMTFALNHLNYFYLTQLLQDTLIASAPARIVNVSSDAHRGGKINFDDLMSEKSYSGFGVYSMTKLANVLFTNELAQRLEGSGVTANSLHPGFVATNFGKNNGGIVGLFMPIVQMFALSPEKGAETSIHLAASPAVEGVTGKYFTKKMPVQPAKAALDAASQRRLWEVSEKLIAQTQAVSA